MYTQMLAGWIRRVFKLTLVFTFAITTPIGIAIGLATFGHGKTDAGTPPPPPFTPLISFVTKRN